MSSLKVLRRTKKIRTIRFADGQIYTILDMNIDPQTNEVTLYLRKNVGSEFLIIPFIVGLSLLLGYMTYGTMGALIASLVGGVAGFILMKEFVAGQQLIERTLPHDAIIGLDNYFQLKSGNFCLCCHSFDSKGNQVLMENDDYSKMSHRLIEKNRMINHLKGMIATLNYRISESQLSRKELADTVASELKKILESTVPPTRTRPGVPYPTAIPPEAFMGAGVEKEEEE